MSKPKNRNSLLSSHNRTSYSNSSKDEIMTMKYSMKRPDIPLYPLNDTDMERDDNKDATSSSSLAYPDYMPWKDRCNASDSNAVQETQKLDNAVYLNKGYFEAPKVSNEYYSAKNLVQATIFSSSESCSNILREFSQHLVGAYEARNELINKIHSEPSNFKIPPRVTLTASKKEAWLRDLSDPSIPLSKISGKIPHGIRNKVLIDVICTKKIPITKAIWFTKCVLFSELLSVRRKVHSKLASNSPAQTPVEIAVPDKIEEQCCKEWTQHLVDYIYKFSRDMIQITTSEKKQQYMSKLHHLICYIQTLYVESLIEKTVFLSSIIHFLKDGLPLEPHHMYELMVYTQLDADDDKNNSWSKDLELNMGQILVTITLFKSFWKDILKVDYLCKEVNEWLLLVHFFVKKISLISPNSGLNGAHQLSKDLVRKAMDQISNMVTYLFKYNSNVFIIPTYWVLTGDSLYNILLGERDKDIDIKEREDIHKQLKLINFRNESLILNMRNFGGISNPSNVSNTQKPSKEALAPNSISPMSQVLASPTYATFANDTLEEYLFITRSPEDTLRIVDQLDRLRLSSDLAHLVTPNCTESTEKVFSWKTTLKLMIYWAVSSYRESEYSSEIVLIICNFLKRNVLQSLKARNAFEYHTEFESEILEIIYNLVESQELDVTDYSLYVLINELYQLKIITISSYLRKLIASGVFYSVPGEELSYNQSINVHLNILRNLPVLNNKQCDSILKKWTTDGFNFKEKFERGKTILKTELVQKVLDSSFDKDFRSRISYFRTLTVGLRFLLVNWVTTELKTLISESSETVVVSPRTILCLYNFYSSSDNLTVFFKVLMTFILRNEKKTLSYGSDSLHLVSQLIIRHFKLVKFIAGGSHESSSTLTELFKLILMRYKELESIETRGSDFAHIWKFMDKTLEKGDSLKANDTSESDTKPRESPFIKEQFGTPMKINTQDNRAEEYYSSFDFRNDLDRLLSAPSVFLDFKEANTMTGNLSASFEATLLLDPATAIDTVNEILNCFSESVSKGSETGEVYAARILLNTKHLIGVKQWHSYLLKIQEYVIAEIDSDKTVKELSLVLKKLLCFEVCSMAELIELIPSQMERPKKSSSIALELVFGNEEDEMALFTDQQQLTLKLGRQSYILRPTTNILYLVLSEFCSSSTRDDSPPVSYYNDRILQLLQHFLLQHTKLFMDQLKHRLRNEDIKRLLNELVKNGSTEAKSCQDLANNAALINEFNLAGYQILLSVCLSQEFGSPEMPAEFSRFKEIVTSMLDNVRFHFNPSSSFFGELFNYLTWNQRVNILEVLETKFLVETKISEGNPSNLIRFTNHNSTNLLPPFKDYFKKFSSSANNIVASSPQFFQNVSSFLRHLLLVVNMIIPFEQFTNLYDTISIFLRIIIIHKSSLITVLLKQEEGEVEFVTKLVSLLNSEFVTQNERLKILLYDILLLMKSSLTQEVSIKTETEEELTQSVQSNRLVTPEDQQKELDATAFPSRTTYPTQITSVFNLPEPTQANPLKEYIYENDIQCSIMLDQQELSLGGDVSEFNNSSLRLVSNTDNDIPTDFDLLGSSNAAPRVQSRSKLFKLRSFEILEDFGSSLNDSCVNLSFFDAYTTRENPP